jgi:integral membrane protein
MCYRNSIVRGSLLQKFEQNQVFTEEDGWMLFRIAAIAEACGWSLLILGIACEHYVWPGNPASIVIAGRIHGTLFLMYAVAAVGLYPTLGWSRKRAFVALLASVPPYGSLLFEQWSAHVRRTSQLKIYSSCTLLTLLEEDV